MPTKENIAKGASYNAEEYAENANGKAIAAMVSLWEMRFHTNEVEVCKSSDSDSDSESEEDEEEEDEQ